MHDARLRSSPFAFVGLAISSCAMHVSRDWWSSEVGYQIEKAGPTFYTRVPPPEYFIQNVLTFKFKHMTKYTNRVVKYVNDAMNMLAALHTPPPTSISD